MAGNPASRWKKAWGKLWNTSKLNSLVPLAVIAFCIILTPAISSASDPSIVNISVSATDRVITTQAFLVDGFDEDIQEAIESGVPLTFTYTVELVKHVDVLGDDTVSRNVLHQTLRYDNLKNVYTFTSKGKGVKRKVTTRHRNKAEKLMLTLDNIPIASVSRLDPQEQYYVRVRAELEADGFWFPFNYLLFFVPFNEFETSWAESSPLIMDPNLTLTREAEKKKSTSVSSSKGVKHVLRSFNK